MTEQAEINIGVVGHVDHGKTSLVKAITGEWTDRHSEEKKRGITIRLGYADASVYACKECKPQVYLSTPKCPKGHTASFIRKISFVDCPGHESLMAVMISGASMMDGALLVIAANEECPQPQTQEHLNALEIAKIKNIVIVQNKIDLVTKEQADQHYKKIKQFVKGTCAENAPIIPASSNYQINTNYILEAIETIVPTPKRDLGVDFRMNIARSFDVNKPGTEIDELNGGVVGGTPSQGKIKVGDKIEIKPGYNGKPIETEVKSISTKDGKINEAVPGGLIGICTGLDPAITKSDGLVGNIIGKIGTLPQAKNTIEVETSLFEKTIVISKIEPIKLNEVLVINAGTYMGIGKVSKLAGKKITLEMKKPICIDKGEKIVILRKIGVRWALIGYGEVK